MNNKYEFFRCDCTQHALEFDYDIEDKTLYVSVWELSVTNPILSWRERIRWVWQIVRTGKPWADHVCLDSEKVERMKKFLQEMDK